MLFNGITIIDENLEVKENMCVAVNGDMISYVGSEVPKEDYGRVIDGKGKLLMSGFVNSHGHSPMTLLRGYGENMNLQDWLFTKIFPYEAHLTSEAVYAGTMLALAESLRTGIVSTSDMYYFCEDMVRAYIDSKSKGNICRSISIMDDVPLLETVPGRESLELFENFDGAADGKIKIDMSLHSEYTNITSTVRALSELRNSLGCGMQVHVSETSKEVDECKERHGVSPVKYLADEGLFEGRTIAGHCVWVDDEDIKILKEKKVHVATNPVSNLKLASGVCNVAALLDAGVSVSIGTDSVASNNNLDMIQEMKLFAIAPKMYYNQPSRISSEEALAAATIAGAKAQGRDDTGILAEGKKADLIMLDVTGPNMYPVHNMLDNIVFAGSGRDVVMTMVEGEVLYENGEYKSIDIEKAIYELEKCNKEILSKL